MPRITPTAILAFILILTACSGYRKEAKNDFLKIVESDTLRVLTLNTSTSYFIYRDIEMGYHYDMVKNFADENNLNLKIIVLYMIGSFKKLVMNIHQNKLNSQNFI